MTDSHTTTVTEFAPKAEVVAASLDIQCITGERLVGPVVVGCYPGSGEDPELWIEQEGQRVQFQASALPALTKQLRRAAKIAQEAEHGN